MSGRLGGAFRQFIVIAPLVLIIASYLLISGMGPSLAAPEIQLVPQQGLPGTNLKVMGSGFATNSAVMLTFDGNNMNTHPGVVTANSLGKFEASFGVPYSTDDGTYPVVAKDFSPLHNTASSTFLVSSTNQPPTAESYTITTNENEQSIVNLDGIDPDGDEITYSIIDQPAHGFISQFDPASGTLTYVPENNYSGPDSFTFKVNDGKFDSAIATVSINVLAANGGPGIENKNVEVKEDTPIDILLTANDDWPSSVSFEILTAPDHGTLGEITQADAKTAHVTYTPKPDYNGIDSFTVRAGDGGYQSQIATVSINVIPIQDGPVAQSVQISTSQGHSVAVTLVGSDVDGDPLSYTLASSPAHGSLSGSTPNLSYFPYSDYQGTDDFAFKVNDGHADSNVAQVKITILAGFDNGDASNPNQNPPESAPTGDQSGSLPAQGAPLSGSSSGGTDTVPPRLIFPSSTLVFDSQSEAGTSVSYTIVAIDNNDGEVPAKCSPESGSMLPVGKVNVVCTATDASGNKALGSFLLEVRLAQNLEQKFDAPQLKLPDSDVTVITSGVIALAGMAVYAGLKAARKTRTESSQPQKSA